MLKGIYLLRHAQSMSNFGNPLITNSPLSPKGKIQASQLKYITETLICSPMRRALDTLGYSNISYDRLIIDQHTREIITEPGDCFKHEIYYQREDPVIFNRKMRALANSLYLISLKSPSILLITHGCVIKALTNKQVSNCELSLLSTNRLKDIISGKVELFTEYHNMTGW